MKRYTRSIIGLLGILSIACMMLSTFISPASIGQMLGIQALRDQGQVAHAAAACVSPSSGFDPTTATAAQLAEYNLPAAPGETNSAAYRQWKTMVQGAKKQTCYSVRGTEAVPTNTTTAAASTSATTGSSKLETEPLSYWKNQYSGYPVQSTSTTTGSSKLETEQSFRWVYNRSGYAIEGDRDSSTINEIYGEWNIPCNKSGDTSSSAVSLIQLGDYSASPQAYIGVTEDRQALESNEIFWSIDNTPANYLPDYNLSCPDHMRAEITYDGNSTVSVFIEDASQGIYFRQGSTSTSLGKGDFGFCGEMRLEHLSGNTYTLPGLYNFGSVNWTSVQVASTNSNGAVTSLAPIEQRGDTVMYNMGSGNHPLAQPSSFGSAAATSSSFTDTFYNAGV